MKKPYFKKSHGCWYVNDASGKPIRLDPDEQKAHEIWANMLDSVSDLNAPGVSYRRLAEEWIEEHYQDTPKFQQEASRVLRFALYVGRKPADKLTKSEVRTWLSEPKPGQKRKDGSYGPSKEWSQRTKHDAFRAVSRVLTWAAREGYIQKNPLAGMKASIGRPRMVIVTPDQHRRLIELADPPLRSVLIAARSGCRPRQIREVSAYHVSEDQTRWVFQDHKTVATTGRPLVVYLPPCLQTLTQLLCEVRPTGPLFLNSRGDPWTKDHLVKSFRDLRDKVGLPTKLTLYAYRHTFATEALKRGVSLAEVAALLGHTDTRMVSQVYGHLDKHQDHLLNAASRVFNLE